MNLKKQVFFICEKKRVIQAMEDRQLIKYVAKQFGILLSALLMIFKTKIASSKVL